MSITVLGEPERLDTVARPVMFIGLGLIGLVFGAVLAWLGIWWWVPIPLASFWLGHAIYFGRRRDIAIALRYANGQLECTDRKADRVQSLSLAEAHVATLAYRAVEGTSEHLVYMIFHSTNGPLLALRARTPARDWGPDAADLDALKSIFGGNAGVLRGWAGPENVVRQILVDDEGELLRAIIADTPAAAWGRCALRVWRGAEPDLDFIGLHTGTPDALIILEDAPHGPVLRGIEPHPASVTGHSGAKSDRILQLLAIPGQDDRYARLPVTVWEIADGVRLCMPAPLAGKYGESTECIESDLHTHLAEGAAAAWWLFRRLDTIPSGLSEAIASANSTLPEPIARHLTPRD